VDIRRLEEWIMADDFAGASEMDDRLDDRRSSVRVRSSLPCSIQVISSADVEAVEAQLLDRAVVESDGVDHDMADWSERTEDLPRESVFLLNEVRALRQQVAELQRILRRKEDAAARWVVANDRGLWFESKENDPVMNVGDFLEVHLRIASVQYPDIHAVAEVIRASSEEDGPGFVVRFRAISQAHSKAIIRYAIRRERESARSSRY
jgi:hypothetical protein